MGIQHQFILDLLSDGKWHCSNEIPYRDYRRRVQDLIDGINAEHRKFPIQKEFCRGRCGRKHNATVNWLRLEAHQMPRNAPGQDLPARASNYASPKPLPPICCSLARAGTGFHTRGCEAQKEPV